MEATYMEHRLFTEPNEDDPDDAMDVWMDGEVIMTVTYNDVGYDGMRVIQNLVELIAQQM
jgi:hypothetical protein